MSRWTFGFLILTVVAGILGFGDTASGLAGLAQILFGLFLAIMLISLVAGLVAQADEGNKARD
jgi:uncharacterized membrane protein YtjA (UPF0391 family)